MVTDLKNLLRLTKTQVKPAAEVYARAFHTDPQMNYYFPEAAQRKRLSPYVFRVLIRYGIRYGEVYATSSNLEGIAMWITGEKAGITLWRMFWVKGYLLYLQIGKAAVSKMLPISEYMYSQHKRHAPLRHWYLFLLGVDPVSQGKGYASILLKPMLARIDQEQLPCYLETENETNIPFYEHFGFRLVEKSIIPGTDIDFYSMLREK